MALPQEVLESLSREPPKTPGWSFGMILFSGGLLFLTLLIYFGLTLGYEPYISNQIDKLNTESTLKIAGVSTDSITQLATVHSETANLQSIISNHTSYAEVLSWLEKYTEQNVYFSEFSAVRETQGKVQIALTGIAPTEADVNNQAAIFEAASDVSALDVSSVYYSTQNKNWQFTVSFVLDRLEPGAIEQSASASSTSSSPSSTVSQAVSGIIQPPAAQSSTQPQQ